MYIYEQKHYYFRHVFKETPRKCTTISQKILGTPINKSNSIFSLRIWTWFVLRIWFSGRGLLWAWFMCAQKQSGYHRTVPVRIHSIWYCHFLFLRSWLFMKNYDLKVLVYVYIVYTHQSFKPDKKMGLHAVNNQKEYQNIKISLSV